MLVDRMDGEILFDSRANSSKVSLPDIVQYVLQKYPDTHKNENLLMLKVWKLEHKHRIKNPEYKFRDFGVSFMKGEYSSARAILKIKDSL